VGSNLALLYLLDDKAERALGIMKWYPLPGKSRRGFYRMARELKDSGTIPGQESVEFDATEQKIDKVEGLSLRLRE